MNLYKYTKANVGTDILNNLAIRFTPPKEFNDSFEVSPYLEAFSSKTLSKNLEIAIKNGSALLEINKSLEVEYNNLAEEHKKTLTLDEFKALSMSIFQTDIFADILNQFIVGFPKQVAREFTSKIPGYISDALGFLCLVKDPLHELMWAHYADSHQGVAIVFDQNHNFFQQKGHLAEQLRKVREVRYEKVRPKFTELLAQNINDIFNKKLLEALFFTKSEIWAYEKEFRCIRPLKEADSVAKVSNKEIHLYNFPADALQGVIFGSRCTKDDQGVILELVENIKKIHGVNLQCSRIDLHEKEYELVLKPIQ